MTSKPVEMAAMPYVDALYDLGEEHKSVDLFAKVLEGLVDILKSHDPLRDFLTSQSVSRTAHEHVMAEIASKFELPIVLKNFLRLLAKNRRLNLLPDIAYLFGRRVTFAKGGEFIKVHVASELSDSEKDQIKKKVGSALKKDIHLDVVVQPELLGGMRIKMRDFVFDDSIQAKLATLHRVMKGMN